MLEATSSILLQARDHSLVVALSAPSPGSSSLPLSPGSPSAMAASVLLCTVFGEDHMARVDALLACNVPPSTQHGSSPGANAGQCIYPGCTKAPRDLCPGNLLVELDGGDWALSLPHHKSHLKADPPQLKVWAAGSREARLFTTFRGVLYSGHPSLPFTSSHVAPLLFNPESLHPLIKDSWAASWERIMRNVCANMAETGELTSIEYKLVEERRLLPETSRELRHSWACFEDGKLRNQQLRPSPDQLKEAQKAKAKAMGTSSRQWRDVYAKGYEFWLHHPHPEGWEGLMARDKRAFILQVLEECKEAVAGPGEGDALGVD